MFKKIKNSVLTKAALKASLIVGGLAALFIVPDALAAAPTAVTLSDISKNVDTSVTQLATVLTDVSLIAGIGFIMASFFKFHQHKLNPTQVPISQGITLLLIGAGLCLFPTMLPTATKAIFGSATIAKVGGGQIGSIIGSGT